MTQYTKKIHKPHRHIESPQLVAAANLVNALHNGIAPAMSDLEVISLACQEMLRGVALETAWGLAHGRGRPPETGITTAEIVSAYIELEHRRLGKTRGALTTAKKRATKAFGSYREPDHRKIEDYWSKGKALVAILSDEDLESMLSPHALPDKK